MDTEQRQVTDMTSSDTVVGITSCVERSTFNIDSNTELTLDMTSGHAMYTMDMLTPSRNLTLADLQARLATDASLPKRRRQDLQSALRTMGKALDKPLDELPAQPDTLRTCLAGFVPSMAGLSERRWLNTLSLVRSAMTRYGTITIPARARTPLTPPWAALFALIDQHRADGTLPKGKRDRAALSRFAHYCGDRGIEPLVVDDAVFDRFLADITHGALIEDPRVKHREATMAWNRLAETLPGWPLQSVTVPSYSRTYALPWDRFPASLWLDVQAYLAHLGHKADIRNGEDAAILADEQEGGDVLTGGVGFRPLQPSSLKTVQYELSLYVSALVYRGHDPQALRTLADVVALKLVRDGLRFFLNRRKKQPSEKDKPTAQVIRIARRLSYVAQHWARVDAEHLAELKAICRRLEPKHHQGMTAKNRGRLRQLDDPAALRRLLRLPQTLQAIVLRNKTPGLAEALLLQTALAIEILIMLQIRRHNLAGLHLERHLVRGRGGLVHLVIPEEEVKNRVVIEGILPPPTVQLLDLYCKRYRPLLLTEPCGWLFPGAATADRPKCDQRLGAQISAAIKEYTGLDVHPHLFRHTGAKSYLDKHPGAYGVIRLVEGHKSVDTTTKYYCGAERDAALKHYNAHIIGLRDPDATPEAGQ